MKSDNQTGYRVRDAVLKLLSDEEIARVSMAETAERLAEGDEYVDLDHPDRGVRRAFDAQENMGKVLPRKAVREDTWSAILRRLEEALSE